MSDSSQLTEMYGQCQQVLTEQFALTHESVSHWLSDDGQHLIITLPFCCASLHRQIEQQLIATGVNLQRIELRVNVEAKKTKVKRLPQVKNIIAIASGKGGVGKSTSAVNLAYALMAEGASVGIIDADIYGPSIPIMLGKEDERPQSEDQKHMIPIRSHGLVSNSIGYLVPAEDAAVWRGPVASRALMQLMQETRWPALDYLIVDMPPGTGDIQLTMAQQLPLTAAVIITTPQDLALADGRKGIAMFEKVGVPVLGVLENMSYYQCRKCGHQEAIFSNMGGEKLANQYRVPLLGQIPLSIDIRQHADGGQPFVVALADSPVSEAYRSAARQLSQNLAMEVARDDSLQIDIVEKH